MDKLRAPLAFLCLFLVFVSIIFIMLHSDLLDESQRDVKLSVVVFGNNNNRWRYLDQGIQQACRELGIKKPLTVLSGCGGAKNQQQYLEQEIAAGAQGLLVAVEDDSLAPYLESLSIPVVAIVSGAGDSVPVVSANDAAMAQTLANLHAGKGKTVAVLEENLQRSDVRIRYNAFNQRAAQLGQPVLLLKNRYPGMTTEQFIRHSMRVHHFDVLVVLDNDSLESAAMAAACEPDIEICGIGSSQAVVQALDNGQISELCFSNEYAIGYVGTMTLASHLDLVDKASHTDIQYSIIRRETMYSPHNERILFPIMH